MNPKDFKEMRECFIKIEGEPYERREQLYKFLKANNENIYNDSHSCLLLNATISYFPTVCYSTRNRGEWCGTHMPHNITISQFLDKYGVVDIYTIVPPRISFR